MTNTRITDPEILERRYPVVLRQFSLREGASRCEIGRRGRWLTAFLFGSHYPGSGGEGMHPGGDGVIRDIEFLECVLSNNTGPY
jgi:5-oxoprolinase (ATP-hydrolysing)